MSGERDISGACLCGAVRFSVRAKSMEVGVCHCSMCRRWTGGPFMAVEAAAPPAFAGEEHVAVYRSSDWAERGFCGRCGTVLFWRMPDGRHYAVSAGALDSASAFTLGAQVFIDEKPDFYDFANDTPKLTGQQVFELFSEDGNAT
jgi:hypothetical protein